MAASKAASRCTGRPSSPRAPRALLPSTATTRRPPAGPAAALTGPPARRTAPCSVPADRRVGAPTDRRFARRRPAQTQPEPRRRGQLLRPLRDRGERSGPGQLAHTAIPRIAVSRWRLRERPADQGPRPAPRAGPRAPSPAPPRRPGPRTSEAWSTAVGMSEDTATDTAPASVDPEDPTPSRSPVRPCPCRLTPSRPCHPRDTPYPRLCPGPGVAAEPETAPTSAGRRAGEQESRQPSRTCPRPDGGSASV